MTDLELVYILPASADNFLLAASAVFTGDTLLLYNTEDLHLVQQEPFHLLVQWHTGSSKQGSTFGPYLPVASPSQGAKDGEVFFAVPLQRVDAPATVEVVT